MPAANAKISATIAIAALGFFCSAVDVLAGLCFLLAALFGFVVVVLVSAVAALVSAEEVVDLFTSGFSLLVADEDSEIEVDGP